MSLMINHQRIDLHSTCDIVTVRLQARELAIHLGFGSFEVTQITAAISQVARFVVHQSRRGELLLEEINQSEKSGISITAQAECVASSERKKPTPPGGQVDVAESNVSNLRGLMHEFSVASSASGDTTIIMKRWK